MNLKVNKFKKFSLRAKDEFGNEASLGSFDNVPSFMLSDQSLGEVLVDANGLSCTVKPNGNLGTCELHFNAQSAGKHFEGSASIDFIPGDAISIELVPGEESDNDFDPSQLSPEPVPEPAPAPEEPSLSEEMPIA